LGRFKDPIFQKYKNQVPLLKHFKEIKKLYEKDSENIKNGFYLAPQKVLPNLKEYGLLNIKNTLDLFRVKDRIQKKDTEVFEKDFAPGDFPDYFKQNFHYQSGGYLSAESAELYDHQVELVFSGTAEAMRRHALKAITIARGIQTYPSNEKLKILDIGCGTGHFTAELKRHFPMSEVTGLDLSPWYLKEAQKKFPNSAIDWKFGKAEKLPYEDNSFDIVTSVYLFHELPEDIRTEAAKEMLRILKPGGTLVQMDSLQKGDVPDLDPSLEVFPHLYHEPYYKNYVSQKSEELFESIGLKEIASEDAFYSKIVRGTKSAS
jgi:ubiquinone/menaquinone biosynthesis C-methylase UbiE